MSLSQLLLRVSHTCRVGSAVRLSSTFSPIASSSVSKLLTAQTDKVVTKVHQKQQPTFKLDQSIRSFSVSPIVQSSSTKDHSKLWTIERYVSAGMLFALPLGIMCPNILFDLVMAVSIVMHTHWGIEAIVIDYLRPSVVGAAIAKIGHISVYVLSIFILVGLLNLIFVNVGLGKSIQMIWSL